MMRLVRTLTQLAMPGVAVMALVAPPALADHGGEFLHNQTPRMAAAQEVHAAADVACPAVIPSPPPLIQPTSTNGGCRQHYTAPNVVLTAHLSAGGSEVVVSSCAVEFDLRIDSAGEGWLSHQEFTVPPVGACTRKPCGQVTPPTSEGGAFPFYLQETEPAPREVMRMMFCLQTLDGAQTSYCHISFTMIELMPHRYRFDASDAQGAGGFFPRCEIDGTFDVEAVLGTSGEGQTRQNIEVRHT
jgi:hypothetical protein